jgi:hypothetical protein
MMMSGMRPLQESDKNRIANRRSILYRVFRRMASVINGKLRNGGSSMRTDRALAAPRLAREKNQRRLRSRRSCLTALLLAALLGVLAVVAVWRFPEQAAALRRRALPQVQRVARAAAGEISLAPFQAVLQESDLDPTEKAQWHDFAGRIWELAEATSGAALARSDVIELSRAVVQSEAGLYYGLRALRRGGLESFVAEEDARQAHRLRLERALAALREGWLAPAAVARLNAHLPALLIDRQAGGASAPFDRPARRRMHAFLDELRDWDRQSGAPRGASSPRDMAAGLREQLRRFRQAVLQTREAKKHEISS